MHLPRPQEIRWSHCGCAANLICRLFQKELLVCSLKSLKSVGVVQGPHGRAAAGRRGGTPRCETNSYPARLGPRTKREVTSSPTPLTGKADQRFTGPCSSINKKAGATWGPSVPLALSGQPPILPKESSSLFFPISKVRRNWLNQELPRAQILTSSSFPS